MVGADHEHVRVIGALGHSARVVEQIAPQRGPRAPPAAVPRAVPEGVVAAPDEDVGRARARRGRGRARGHVSAERGPWRRRSEFDVELVPQLRRSTAVVQVPDADSSQVVGGNQVVLAPERGRIVPVQLPGALQPRVEPRVPSLLARRIVGIAVGRIASGLDLRRGRLASRIQVGVRDHAARRISVWRRSSNTRLAAVVRNAQDHLRCRRDCHVLVGGGRVVVVVTRERPGGPKAHAGATGGRARVVGVLEVVGHDEKRVRIRTKALDVKESKRIGGRAGVRVDGQVGAGRECRPQVGDKGGELVPRPRWVRRTAAAVQTFEVDVDAIDPFCLDLCDSARNGRGHVGQAGAHVGSARAEVLEDDRQHDLGAGGVSRAQEPCQLGRVPNCPVTVMREVAVGLHVQTEEGHRAQKREVPARIAHGGIAQAAGQPEPEDLAVWTAVKPRGRQPWGWGRGDRTGRYQSGQRHQGYDRGREEVLQSLHGHLGSFRASDCTRRANGASIRHERRGRRRGAAMRLGTA